MTDVSENVRGRPSRNPALSALWQEPGPGRVAALVQLKRVLERHGGQLRPAAKELRLNENTIRNWIAEDKRLAKILRDARVRKLMEGP